MFRCSFKKSLQGTRTKNIDQIGTELERLMKIEIALVRDEKDLN